MRDLVLCALAGALLSAGCYRYVPTRVDALPAGTQVRARLSADQADRFAEALQSDDRVIEGRVLENGNDDVLLLVPVWTGEVGGRRINQRLNIPQNGITEVELKELDRTKTYGLVGVAALVVGVAAARSIAGDGGQDPPPGPGGPQEIRLPFRLPFGFGH